MKYDQIQQAAYKANMQLPELGLVLFTFGNVSAVDRSLGVFVIKPRGISYGELTHAKMVDVDLEGNIVEVDSRPSSDILTHSVLYKHWKNNGGIVHTPSTYATAWTQSQRDISIVGTTHADHNTVNIPCVSPMDDAMIISNYEYETGFQIMKCFNEKGLNYEEVEMILVSSHASLAWRATPEKAVYNSAVLERVTQMAYLSEQINPESPRLKRALINKHYERKHGKAAY